MGNKFKCRMYFNKSEVEMLFMALNQMVIEVYGEHKLGELKHRKNSLMAECVSQIKWFHEGNHKKKTNDKPHA